MTETLPITIHLDLTLDEIAALCHWHTTSTDLGEIESLFGVNLADVLDQVAAEVAR